MSAVPTALPPPPPAGPRDDASLWRRLHAARTPAEAAAAWLPLAVARLAGAEAGLVLGREADGAFRPLAHWPLTSVPEAALAASAERCLNAKRGHCEWQAGAGRLALPVEIDGESVAAVVVGVRAGAPPQLPAQLAELRLAAGWLAMAWLAVGRAQAVAARAADAEILSVLALLGTQRTATEAALALVNALAERYGATRASVGWLRGGRLRLLAISHSAGFDARSALVQTLENALEETLDQRRGLGLPPLPGRAPGITLAHRALAAGQTLASAWLPGRDRLGGGALLLERPAERPFTAEDADRLAALGAALGPLFEDKAEAERWFAGRPAEALRGLGRGLRDPRRPSFRLAALALVAALAWAAGWPLAYRINADAVIEGAEQRAVAAPFDGYLYAAHYRAGQTVRAGTVLAELDDRTLRLEQARWSAEAGQHERRLRDAFAKHDRPAAGLARAAFDQAQAQLALVEQRLSRARLVSPFDAVVVSGDLTQQLGTPVEQGRVLFELAPLAAWRVILYVDEHDIRSVATGQAGQLVLAGLAGGEGQALRVVNIAVPETRDGRNVFRVEAELSGADARLRPGMEGVAKIEAGTRSPLWLATHRAFDWLRLQLWRYAP